MLSFRVFAKFHPRRFVSPLPHDLCGQRLTRPAGASQSTLIPLEGRQTVLSSFIFQTLHFQLLTFNFSAFSTSPKSFICNIYAPPRPSVANKRLTAKLNRLDATFTQ